MNKISIYSVVLFSALIAQDVGAIVTFGLSEAGFVNAFGVAPVTLVNATSPLATYQANVIDDDNYGSIWAGAPSVGDQADFIITTSVTNASQFSLLYPSSGSPLNDRTASQLLISYQPGGLRATKAFNSNPAYYSGDLIAASVEVRFASHVRVKSDDLNVSFTSLNTAGTIFESSAIVFIGSNGSDIGSYTYNGYHAGAGTLPGNGANAYTASANVFVATSVNTIDWSTPLSPSAGSSGANDSGTINAASFVGSSVELKGFRLVSYLENSYLVSDGSGGVTFGGPTATNSSFTDTLTGFTISDSSFPVELQSFSVD